MFNNMFRSLSNVSLPIWVIIICLAGLMVTNSQYVKIFTSKNALVTDIRQEIGNAIMGNISNPPWGSVKQQPGENRNYSLLAYGYPSDYVVDDSFKSRYKNTFLWAITYLVRKGDYRLLPYMAIGSLHINYIDKRYGAALHADIRKDNNLSFSVWGGNLYFSKNIINEFTGQKYKLFIIENSSNNIIHSINIIFFILILICFASLIIYISKHDLISRIIFINLALMAVVLIGFLYFFSKSINEKIKFPDSSYEQAYFKNVGYLYKSGSITKYTNQVEYWAESPVNSYGMLDKEPNLNAKKIIGVIGDSFVESVQVNLADKFFVIAECKENKLTDCKDKVPDEGTEIIAMGYSGYGQAQELAFLKEQFNAVKFDIVFAVIVSNDVANNSPELETLRYGCKPDKLGRSYIDIDKNNKIEMIPGFKNRGCDNKGKLIDWYDTYSSDEKIGESIKEIPRDVIKNMNGNVNCLDRIPFDHPQLEVSRKALYITEQSIILMKEMIAAKGGSLVFILTDTLPSIQRKYWRNLADKYGIKIIDIPQKLHNDFHWKFDGHWNIKAHKYVANLITNYIDDRDN